MTFSKQTGELGWLDLTVADATTVQQFYQQVLDWQAEPLNMGDYDDYVMKAGGEAVAGICHARGTNANVPPQWLVYINVPDLDASLERCLALGGQVVDGTRDAGGTRMCVIRDPAGAVLALASPTS